MATILDIIDTAVKIGLGAFISGATTYYVTRNSYKHEREHDLIVYKRNKLVEISEHVQKAGELSNQIEYLIGQKRRDGKSIYDQDFSSEAEMARDICGIISSATTICYLIDDNELAEIVKLYFKNRNLLYVFLVDEEKEGWHEYFEIKNQVNKVRLNIFDQYSESLSKIYA